MQGRPGVAYLSVSFPNGSFRGVYLDKGVLRFIDSHPTPEVTIARRYNLVGVDGLALYEEQPWTYDPRSRDFYRQAVSARGRVWTKPYAFFSSRQTGVTRAAPVFRSGAEASLHAVLTADFDVPALSKSLAQTAPRGVRTLLFANDGTLLAYPQAAAELARLPLPTGRLAQLGDLGDPVIDAFFSRTRGAASPPGEFIHFTSGSEAMLAMLAPVPEFPELAWNVAAIVPEQLFFASRIRHERQSLWVAGLSLLLALSIGIIFARHIVRVRREAASASRRARRASERARELGSYQLVQLLGKGGMGEVWRAEHRLLARQAAIKLIRPERLASSRQSTAHLRQRFRREAQTLAALKSRHTISLFDYGVTDDGTFFFVMELLDGMDLETLVKRHGVQPAGRVIHILLQALSSLSEAHDAGLVHRDVKPANLFVCRAADEVDIVKVLDFGIVQSASERNSRPPQDVTLAELEANQLTQAGQLLGTPQYMAPEQILGHRTDGRADLYALGLVGLWLLSGKLLFDESTVLATMVAHVSQPLPDLSTVASDLPPPLEHVLRQCLEKLPEDRPKDARAVAALLRDIPLAPDEVWTADRAQAWWEQRMSQSREPKAELEGQPRMLLVRDQA